MATIPFFYALLNAIKIRFDLGLDPFSDTTALKEPLSKKPIYFVRNKALKWLMVHKGRCTK